MLERSEVCPARESLLHGRWRDTHEIGTSKVARFPLCRKMLKRGARSNNHRQIDECMEA